MDVGIDKKPCWQYHSTMSARSGKFVLRLPPSLHDRLAVRSRKEGQSLNGLCLQLLALAIDRPKDDSLATGVATPALGVLRKQYGPKLLGVVAFGSRISGTATDASDLDLLVILAKSVPIRRRLYRQWDEAAPLPSEAGLEFDPHFAHMPDHARDASAVWLEAASSGDVLFDPRGQIKKLLEAIRKPIAEGVARRAWSHGHPYWTRSDHEES